MQINIKYNKKGLQ